MTEGRDWAPLVLLCAAAALAGLLEVLFVPFYIGSVLTPVVVPIALVTNYVWTRLGYTLVRTTTGAVAPFVCWVIPVLGLALFPRPEGDVIVIGGGGQQWVYYGLLLLGCLSGFVSIVIITGDAKRLARVSR